MLQKEPCGQKSALSLSLSVPQSPFPEKTTTIKQIQTKIGAYKQTNTKYEQIWNQEWCTRVYLTVQATEAPLVSYHIPRSLQEMWSEKSFL